MLIPEVGRKKWRVRIILIGITAFLWLGVVLHLFPFYWAMAVSVTPPDDAYKLPPNFFPSHPDFLVYRTIFSHGFTLFMRSPLWVYVKNSFIMTGGIIAIQIPLMALVAYSLSKLISARWNRIVFLFFIGTMFVPGSLTIISRYLLLRYFPFISKGPAKFPTYNFLDSYWAVILPATFSGFSILLFKGFFDTIPNELLNAARLDGASEIGIFRRIVLPLSRPVFSVVCYFTFIGSWNNFLWPLIVLKKDRLMPLSLMIYNLQAKMETSFRPGEEGGISWYASNDALKMGYGYTALMAVAIIEAIPVFLMFIVFREEIMKGVRLRGFK